MCNKNFTNLEISKLTNLIWNDCFLSGKYFCHKTAIFLKNTPPELAFFEKNPVPPLAFFLKMALKGEKLFKINKLPALVITLKFFKKNMLVITNMAKYPLPRARFRWKKIYPGNLDGVFGPMFFEYMNHIRMPHQNNTFYHPYLHFIHRCSRKHNKNIKVDLKNGSDEFSFFTTKRIFPLLDA